MDARELDKDFERIYLATKVKVLIYITSKCSNTSQIEDIFQETYMELYKLLSKRGRGYIENAEAIVMKIAKQKIYRHYKLLDRVKNFIPMNGETEEESFYFAREEEMTAIEDVMIQKEMINRIKNFLDGKPLEVRKIFYLHYFLDLTLGEIAEQLSMSESNVKNKLYRALKEMRAECRKEDDYE